MENEECMIDWLSSAISWDQCGDYHGLQKIRSSTDERDPHPIAYDIWRKSTQFEIINKLIEAIVAQKAFIDSHVADPDLTSEMTDNYYRMNSLMIDQLITDAKEIGK